MTNFEEAMPQQLQQHVIDHHKDVISREFDLERIKVFVRTVLLFGFEDHSSGFGEELSNDSSLLVSQILSGGDEEDFWSLAKGPVVQEVSHDHDRNEGLALACFQENDGVFVFRKVESMDLILIGFDNIIC